LKSLALESKRRESRRWVRIDCQAVRTRDFRKVGGRILDLSLGGMRIAPEIHDLVEGEQLFVSFEVGDSWIDAEATVVHLLEKEDGVEIGLCFETMDERSFEALASRLPKLPPIVPKRASGTRRVSESQPPPSD